MINAAFKLQDSGFSREQVEALTEFMSGSVATKEDIAEVKEDITALRGELKEDIAELRGELKQDIAELRTELKYIRWIGAVIVAGVLIPLIRDFLV